MSVGRSSAIDVAKRVCAASFGVAALSVGVIAPASAASTVTRGTIVTPIADQGLPDDCRPGITGTLVGTDTLDFHGVENSQGFHYVGTTTDALRITWSDGTYTIGDSVDHFAFNTGKGATVFTDAHKDSGNTYSAAGVFLFRTTFHLIHHFTMVNGDLKSEFETSHIHFFGGPCA